MIQSRFKQITIKSIEIYGIIKFNHKNILKSNLLYNKHKLNFMIDKVFL